MHLRWLWTTIQKTFNAWSDHQAPRLGAALAFYTIVSLAPLLILAVTPVAFVFGRSNAESQILNQAQNMIGEDGANAIRAMIQSSDKPTAGAIASVFGLVTLLFGASGVFGELRSSLNTIWDVKPESTSGIMQLVRDRFFSFGMVLAIGFLLLVSLLLSAGLAAFGKFFNGILPLPEPLLTGINFLVSLCAITILFALIFRYVPARKVPWNPVWLGGFATAFLFTIGKTLIGLYLGKAGVGSAYGAAGSLVVVIIWLYYSAQIFFFGAEFTHVLADRQQHTKQ